MTTLASLGSSDKLVSGKLEQSYFIEKYQKKTQCSVQVLPLNPDIQVNFGEEATIDILQQGDILRLLYLQFTYPTSQPSAVCDSFGTYIFNWVQLEYDGGVIERIDGEFLEMMNDVSVPLSKQGTLSNLTGKYMTSNLATYYINLPFSILNTGLPLCALKKNPLLRINLRNFWEGCPTASRVNPVFNSTLLCTYVFLEENERNYFNKNLTYIYEHTQRIDVDAGYANSVAVCTEFQNPTKEVYVVIKDKTANAYVWNNTFTGGDQLASMALWLDASELLTQDIGTPLFLRGLHGLDSHTRCPDRYFYMYSLCLSPESKSVSGSINMSCVRQKFDIKMSNSNSARLINIYGKCYNILEIQQGKLIVKYPVPFETSGYILNSLKTPSFTLNNPGSVRVFSNVTYYTATSATYTFQLVNIVNSAFPQWTYPNITGITWTPTNTSLILVAAPGTSITNQTVSITAGYGTGITFLLTVDNSSLFVLENPGPLTLYTVVAGPSASRTLTLTNPYSFTPTWSYPTLSGVSWTTSSTGITLTAATASTLVNPSVTVTATTGALSYPQTFYLRVDNTPNFIFVTPVRRVYLTTVTSSKSQSFVLSNPFGVAVSWTYPALTGVSWTTSSTGITLTAAQGSTLATTSVTITATYGAFSSSHVFSLNISPATLENPGDVIIYTLAETTQTIYLSPLYSASAWSYPTIAGITWTTTYGSITIVAPRGASIPTTSVTITATVNGTPYSSTFNLSVYNSFTFTNLDGSSSTAPTSLSGYSSYPGYISLISGIQYWTVPTTTTYNFTVAGAGGTSAYGEKGAVVLGTYTLNQNSLLGVCVGQMGVLVNGRTGSGGTFVVSNIQSINTTSLVTSIPLFIAGGAGGAGNSLQSASASLTITGKTGNNGAAGAIGPDSGGDSTGYGGGGFTYFKNYGGSKSGGFGLGGNYGVSGCGGGGGGYGGGGGAGGSVGSGGGGGLYDITYLYNCSASNSGQGYFRIDTGIRFTLSNAGSYFLLTDQPTNSSTVSVITYTTPNPYGFIPSVTCVPALPVGLSISSSLNAITITGVQGTQLASTSTVITATYGAYSYSITLTIASGPTVGLTLQNPGTSTIYTNYNDCSFIFISLTNSYNIPVTWAITTPPISGIYNSTTTTAMFITYLVTATFSSQTMTVQVTFGSFTTSVSFTINSSSQIGTLVSCATPPFPPAYTVPNSNWLTGVYIYNNTLSRAAFDNRSTISPATFQPIFLARQYSLFARAGDSITAIYRVSDVNFYYTGYNAAYIYDGTGWNYNPISSSGNSQEPGSTIDYTYTFTMPALSAGFYTLLLMDSTGGQIVPTTADSARTALLCTLRILP